MKFLKWLIALPVALALCLAGLVVGLTACVFWLPLLLLCLAGIAAALLGILLLLWVFTP